MAVWVHRPIPAGTMTLDRPTVMTDNCVRFSARRCSFVLTCPILRLVVLHAAQAVHRLCSLHDEHSTLHLRVHAHLSSSSLPACQASNTGPLTVSRLYPVRPPRYSLSPSPLPLVKVLPLPDVSAHAYSPPPPRELTRYLCPSCAMQTRAGPSSTSSSSLSHGDDGGG